jgi:hypothetical protein
MRGSYPGPFGRGAHGISRSSPRLCSQVMNAREDAITFRRSLFSEVLKRFIGDLVDACLVKEREVSAGPGQSLELLHVQGRERASFGLGQLHLDPSSEPAREEVQLCRGWDVLPEHICERMAVGHTAADLLEESGGIDPGAVSPFPSLQPPQGQSCRSLSTARSCSVKSVVLPDSLRIRPVAPGSSATNQPTRCGIRELHQSFKAPAPSAGSAIHSRFENRDELVFSWKGLSFLAPLG